MKNVSRIFNNLAGSAAGSSVLVGDGLRLLELFDCRSTDNEIESRIESMDMRAVWPVMRVLSLSNVEVGGDCRDERCGIWDHIGRSSGEKGIDSKTWMVLVSGGPRSSNGIEWNIERTGPSNLAPVSAFTRLFIEGGAYGFKVMDQPSLVEG